jgi:hypothetical protein
LLAETIEAEALPQLEELTLKCLTIDRPGNFERLMKSVEHAPQLRRLQLKGKHRGTEAALRPFLKALQEGMYPVLEGLDLADCTFPAAVALELAAALAALPCAQTLRIIGIDAAAVGPEGMKALGA